MLIIQDFFLLGWPMIPIIMKPFVLIYNLYENVNVGVDSMEEHMKEIFFIFF